jgi:hypothetical protein
VFIVVVVCCLAIGAILAVALACRKWGIRMRLFLTRWRLGLFRKWRRQISKVEYEG